MAWLFDRIRRGQSQGRDESELEIAALTDEMTRSSFAPECRWTVFGVEDWERVLGSSHPDLLFVESAWQGNDGSWQYRIGSYDYEVSHGLPDLRQLVKWARDRDIPSVFWNKEDPVHFDLFSEAASLFDVVFTSDSNRIDAYRELPELSASVVSALPFAAQPAIHNPVEIYDERVAEACFAGTYYGTRHEARRAELEMILDGAIQTGLRIYDRMADSGSPAFAYPERFQPFVTGSVPYADMVRLYRRFKVFLNTNSVTESPTMFSRRVFELLASGTPVVSTPSVGVEEMFGEIVTVVRSSKETAETVGALLDDVDHWREVSTAGVRNVLKHHTYRHRLQTVCDAAGIDKGEPYADDVAVIALIPSVAVMEAISKQSVKPSRVIVDRGQLTSDELTALSNALGEAEMFPDDIDGLDSIADAAGANHCVMLGDGRSPPEYLLEDLILSRRFSPHSITGTPVLDEDQRRFTRQLSTNVVLASKSALSMSRWKTVSDVVDAVASGEESGYGMRRDSEGWPTL